MIEKNNNRCLSFRGKTNLPDFLRQHGQIYRNSQRSKLGYRKHKMKAQREENTADPILHSDRVAESVSESVVPLWNFILIPLIDTGYKLILLFDISPHPSNPCELLGVSRDPYRFSCSFVTPKIALCQLHTKYNTRKFTKFVRLEKYSALFLNRNVCSLVFMSKTHHISEILTYTIQKT